MVACSFRTLLAGQSVGALDEGDARALARHLAQGCDACAAELESLRAAAGALAESAAPVAPAPRQRARVLARLRWRLRHRSGS